MDIGVTVLRTLPHGAGLVASLQIATTGGHQFETDVPVDFAASATTMNNAIVARAREALAGAFGLTLTASDRTRLFGGTT